MKRLLVYGGIILVIGLGYLGYLLYQNVTLSSKAQAEKAAQEPEQKESRERLTLLYNAWKAYRADHKGAEPPTVEAMIPKYIPNPELLVSPTAVRWRKLKFDMAPGQIKIGDSTYQMSYGFQWLTAGNPRNVKKLGDKAILISDTTPVEALYSASYHQKPPMGAFNPPMIDSLIADVRDAKILVVRRNGTVEAVSPSSE